MEQEFFDRFYQTQYEKMTTRLNQRATRYRNYTRIYQISLLTSSAITPVIVAIPSTFSTQIIAVALSSLVAILTGIGRIFRFEDAWMNARVIRNALRREETCYNAGLFDYAGSEDKRTLFIKRI